MRQEGVYVTPLAVRVERGSSIAEAIRQICTVNRKDDTTETVTCKFVLIENSTSRTLRVPAIYRTLVMLCCNVSNSTVQGKPLIRNDNIGSMVSFFNMKVQNPRLRT